MDRKLHFEHHYESAVDLFVDEIQKTENRYPNDIESRILASFSKACSTINILRQQLIASKAYRKNLELNLRDQRMSCQKLQDQVRELAQENANLKLGGVPKVATKTKKRRAAQDIFRFYETPSF